MVSYIDDKILRYDKNNEIIPEDIDIYVNDKHKTKTYNLKFSGISHPDPGISQKPWRVVPQLGSQPRYRTLNEVADNILKDVISGYNVRIVAKGNAYLGSDYVELKGHLDSKLEALLKKETGRKLK